MACIFSFVMLIQLKILHDIVKKCLSHCLKISKWYDEPLLCCHWVKIFGNEQTRTQPLFSPAISSVTYGNAWMSRQNNYNYFIIIILIIIIYL